MTEAWMEVWMDVWTDVLREYEKGKLMVRKMGKWREWEKALKTARELELG